MQMKWDIDWKKLGHTEPKVKKTTYPHGRMEQEDDKPRESALAIAEKPEKKTDPEAQNAPPEKNDPVAPQPKPIVEIKPKENDIRKETKIETAQIEKPKVLNFTKPPKQENTEEYEENNVRETPKREELRRNRPQGKVSSRLRAKSNEPERKSARPKSSPKRRDLSGGMELLEVDFLLDVVENTEEESEADIIMRAAAFHELIRRDQLKHADSEALTVYAVNTDGYFDKEIQSEAVRELAQRTYSHSG